GYDAMHPGSRVLGRYQIAPKAFRDIGWQDQYGNWTAKAKAHGVASEADFLERPDAQEAALGEYFKRNDEQLQANGSRAHLGEKYVSPIGIGFTVTEAGLAAAAHRAGAKYTTQALEKLESKRNGNPQRFRARCFSAESGFPFSANSDSRLGLGLGDQSR
ncbi:MAG: hypothetical protein ING29_17575, partial [Azospirillum sp.]|nr:hypothetical protein [Azospirillum sp.]